MFACPKLSGDKVVQLQPSGQCGARKFQHILAQPAAKRLDVLDEIMVLTADDQGVSRDGADAEDVRPDIGRRRVDDDQIEIPHAGCDQGFKPVVAEQLKRIVLRAARLQDRQIVIHLGLDIGGKVQFRRGQALAQSKLAVARRNEGLNAHPAQVAPDQQGVHTDLGEGHRQIGGDEGASAVDGGRANGQSPTAQGQMPGHDVGAQAADRLGPAAIGVVGHDQFRHGRKALRAPRPR